MDQRSAIKAIAVLLLMIANPANSQISNESRIQQIEQQRLEQLQSDIESEQRERSRINSPPSHQVPLRTVENRCFEINKFLFEGLSHFSSENLADVVSEYSGKCLGAEQLDSLLGSISAFYFDQGFVTTRAYLPEQNLASGSVTIHISEGLLEEIHFNGVDEESTAVDGNRSVFPVRIDKPLNLRDLEQGLESINRLQSYHVTASLLPGTRQGQTRVEVTQQTAEPWQIQIGANNSGQQSTGEQQLQGLLVWDNPLGFYDFTYLSYQTDTEKSHDKRYSESLAVHWDRPLGYWTIGLDLARFRYQRPVVGNRLEFSASGKSESQKLSVSRVLFRDLDSKVRVKWALTRKQTENYVEDVLLDVSSRTLALSDLSLQYEQYFTSGSFLSSEFSHTRGLKAFGSPDDGRNLGLQSAGPRAQFDRYKLFLDYRHPIHWHEQSFQYRAQWKTQYSPDALFGSEQFSIGSLYTVRGYKTSSLSGESGSCWRNTLSWIVRPEQFLWRDDWLSRLRFYAGLDVGRVRNAYQDERYRSLKGWALGVEAGGSGWSSELSLSSPINAPGDIGHIGKEVSFNVRVSF